MAARELQNGRRGLESGLPLGSGVLLSTLLNRCFDLNTPSMRKVDDGEKKKEKSINILERSVGQKRAGKQNFWRDVSAVRTQLGFRSDW